MADLPTTLEAVKGTCVGQIMKLHVKRGRVSTGAVLTPQTELLMPGLKQI